MNHIEEFENINDPKIGDYVISDFKFYNQEWKNYIDNKIGVVKRVRADGLHWNGLFTGYAGKEKETKIKYIITTYEIENHIFENWSKKEKKCIKKINGKNYIDMYFELSEIKYLSSNKKDLEVILLAKRYNL